MNRYAILSIEGTVTNITVGEYQLDNNWVVCPDEVQIGWKYNGNGNWSSPVEIPTVYLNDVSVLVDGQPAQFFAGNYYANPQTTCSVAAELVDINGLLQAQISFPITLKLPVVRHADGSPTQDEVYFNFTIQNGLAVATTAPGKIERSGDWKIVIERLNIALERMFKTTGAPVEQQFKVSAKDITIIA